MNEDKVKAVERFVEIGVDLMSSTIDQLLSGSELETEKWRSLAKAYELLSEASGGAIPPPLQAIGLLARTVVTPDLKGATLNCEEIPEIQDFNIARVLGNAIVALRYATAQGPSEPRAYSEAADAQYALLPFAQDKTQAIRLFRQAIEGHRKALEILTTLQRWSDATAQATTFTALAWISTNRNSPNVGGKKG
jgi:hypothetical protein